MPDYLSDARHHEIFAVEAALKEMVSNYDVTYHSILDFVCRPNKGCLTHVGNNRLIQWDYGHLTTAGSEYVIRELRRRGL